MRKYEEYFIATINTKEFHIILSNLFIDFIVQDHINKHDN